MLLGRHFPREGIFAVQRPDPTAGLLLIQDDQVVRFENIGKSAGSLKTEQPKYPDCEEKEANQLFQHNNLPSEMNSYNLITLINRANIFCHFSTETQERNKEKIDRLNRKAPASDSRGKVIEYITIPLGYL
jgi:hypothetical protein